MAAGSLIAYSVYGISISSGYNTSRSAVRSSSVGWPMMGWNDAAAVAKRAVISSGIIGVDDGRSRMYAGVGWVGRSSYGSGVGRIARYEAAVRAAVRRRGDGNLRRYEEEHHGGGKIYLLDL